LYYFYSNKPTPAQQRSHYNLLYAFIIAIYLVFSIAQVSHLQNSSKIEKDIPQNYYQVLEIPMQFTSKQLKNSYRSLSLAYHPDKHQYVTSFLFTRQQLTEEAKEKNHEIYLQIRNAYEVLKHPVKSNAYGNLSTFHLLLEKMRDSVMDCSHCVTLKDYLYENMVSYLGFYGGTFVMMLLMDFFSSGSGKKGLFWKYWLILAMASFEAWMLLSQKDPFYGLFFPWRTTGERILILRNLGLSVYMGMNQLIPLFFPAPDAKSISHLLGELNGLSNLQSKESLMAFKQSFEPFVNDPPLIKELHRKMEKLALDTRIDAESKKFK
jgi:hypothetical protein